jgi:thiol-disulfide isomerase/thioredoxin
MKKFNIFILALISLFLLAACTGTQTPAAESSTSEMSEPMSDDTTMDEAMADDTMADEAMPDETMTDETMSDEAMADEAMSDEAMADEAMSDDTMTHDTMAESDEMMSDDSQDEMMDEDNMADMAAWQNIELTDASTGETFTLASFPGKTVFVEPMATWCTNCRQQLGNVREARAQLGDDVVFIGLSLETNLANADLAQYQSDQGFDWTFAVMTPELLQGLADTFGRSITSAPSTPHFVIRSDGSYTDLVTGIDPVDQIVSQIQAAGS